MQCLSKWFMFAKPTMSCSRGTQPSWLEVACTSHLTECGFFVASSLVRFAIFGCQIERTHTLHLSCGCGVLWKEEAKVHASHPLSQNSSLINRQCHLCCIRWSVLFSQLKDNSSVLVSNWYSSMHSSNSERYSRSAASTLGVPSLWGSSNDILSEEIQFLQEHMDLLRVICIWLFHVHTQIWYASASFSGMSIPHRDIVTEFCVILCVISVSKSLVQKFEPRWNSIVNTMKPCQGIN